MTRRQQGFTLIELMVVMSMLAMIMVAMGGAFRTMAQTETRVDEKLQRADQMRVVQQFLRHTVSRVDGTLVDIPQRGQGVLFQASAEGVQWVGIMPARPGVGGRHFFRLALEDTTGGDKGLVIRYLPWAMQTQFPDWTQAESHVLVNRVTQWSVETEGLPRELSQINAEWPRGWQENWTAPKAIPQRMRITLADHKGLWPPMTLSLFPSANSTPVNSGFVIGGGTE
jgi:general secretion pathway protein J